MSLGSGGRTVARGLSVGDPASLALPSTPNSNDAYHSSVASYLMCRDNSIKPRPEEATNFTQTQSQQH